MVLSSSGDERLAIEHYFKRGFRYETIVHFLAEYHGISMNVRTLNRLRLRQFMSYRKHGFWVLIEHCFKQTAIKYVDYSIKLSPYRQFCCPLPLISTLSSANIPVSPRFFGEFDMLTFLPPAILKKPLIPSSTQPTRKPPKAALKPNG